MAVSYECDNCSDTIEDEADVVTVQVIKGDTVKAVNHADQECFDLALSGDKAAIEALLLG